MLPSIVLDYPVRQATTQTMFKPKNKKQTNVEAANIFSQLISNIIFKPKQKTSKF